MLSTSPFADFARDHVLFASVMTHIEGRPNDDLLRRKGGFGFPYVVAMDAAGRVLSRLKQHSVEGFQRLIDEAREGIALRARADATPAERVALFRFDVSVGNLEPEEARRVAASIEGRSDAQKAECERALVDLDITVLRRRLRSPEQLPELGKAYYEMARAGRTPSDPSLRRSFWNSQLVYAETAGDPVAFEFAKKGYLKIFETHPNRDRTRDRLEKRLEKLRADESDD